MSRLVIPIGSKIGLLTIVGEGERIRLPGGQINRTVICKCDCGNTKTLRLLHVIRGRTRSCGCISPKHGYYGTKLYSTWRGMYNRCMSSNYIDHHRYFDRGITMVDEWKKFPVFREWAMANGYKDGLVIDRINNDLGYSPENCRFVTQIVNANNRSVTKMVEYNGSNQSLSLLLRKLGKHQHYSTIMTRLKRGWSVKSAIDTPIRKGNYRRK